MPRLLAHELEDEVGVILFVRMSLWLVEVFNVSDSCLGGMVGLDGWTNSAVLDDLTIVEVEITGF